MKFSIITASFNAASTIEATLRSVASQTHPDIEHLVIDGGSNDGTQAIVNSHGQRVSTFLSEPDCGIYDAMNKGLIRASGDFIGFLNADDVYAHTDVLHRVARTMEQQNLDVLYGDVAFYRSDEPGKIIRRYSSAWFRPDRIAWGWMPAHPSLFVKRDLFLKTGLFRTDFRIAGDFEFVARLFQQQNPRYFYLPEVLVNMSLGGVSTGGWRSTVLLNKEVFRACRDNGIRTNMLKILSKYPVKVLEHLRK